MKPLAASRGTPRSPASRPPWVATLTAGLLALMAAPGLAQWRPSSAQEQALDAVAFHSVRQALEGGLADVQSLFVVSRGRVLFEYQRDGQPDTLRDTQSVAKSALSTLVGIALSHGQLKSLDQPVLELLPEWTTANPDARATKITLRHLLTMSAGFDTQAHPPASAEPLAQRLWARALPHEPGRTFAYDNGAVPILIAVLERATGMPLPQYARQQLVAPLGMHEPAYGRTSARMRTQDMARLGQLYLQDGQWNGTQLLATDYIRSATRAHNKGGPPVGLSYGYLWWVVPSQASQSTFIASGFGGQLIWVHPASQLVVAGTSTVSQDSSSRGQLLQLVRNEVFAAAQQRAQTLKASAPAAQPSEEWAITSSSSSR